MSLVSLRKRRDCAITITITETDGSAYEWIASDAIRVKIGKAGKVPLLDLTSAEDTAAGSGISQANPTTVVIRAADTANFPIGVLDMEVLVVDDSDQDKVKHAEFHEVAILDTPLGGVGR